MPPAADPVLPSPGSLFAGLVAAMVGLGDWTIFAKYHDQRSVRCGWQLSASPRSVLTASTCGRWTTAPTRGHSRSVG